MSEALPFTLDPGDVVERAPWLVLEDGAVFGCHDAVAALAPLLTVAWCQRRSAQRWRSS